MVVGTFRAKTVVVPVDFSADSERAVRTAAEIVESPADLHLVHVLFPLEAAGPGMVWGELTDEKRKLAVKDEFDKLLRTHAVSGAHAEVVFGDAGLEIADYASRVGADLIVVPSHGYHGLKRFVLGSVAERIIRHAACNVLVLRRSDAE